jgi:ABC-type Fe3+-hydroxamate transport system substrate-binding protein
MLSRVFSDQCGNILTFTSTPVRIVSLVPSQTELLFEIGLSQQIAGITKYCVHPKHWLKEKAIIGGTKNFDLEKIDQLNPDLIIGNKEENYQEGIITLQKKYPVWLSDIVTLADSISMIRCLGEITELASSTEKIISSINIAFDDLQKSHPLSVLYLIWRKPWMAAASGTFINTMLHEIGLVNCIQHLERYPQLTAEEITVLAPDLIFLSSEPYPFGEKHIDELQKLSPKSNVMLVDGEMFSWYGSRLRLAPEYFNSLPIPRI